jgi:hypothetical protein
MHSSATQNPVFLFQIYFFEKPQAVVLLTTQGARAPTHMGDMKQTREHITGEVATLSYLV